MAAKNLSFDAVVIGDLPDVCIKADEMYKLEKVIKRELARRLQMGKSKVTRGTLEVFVTVRNIKQEC